MQTKLVLPLLVVLPDKSGDVAATAPTCTTAGYTTYTCDCGESYVDNLVDALGHNYVQSGNVYTCSRCGDSYTGHEHSYTESTTEPTCTQAGYTIYTCSCGDSYTVNLPALGHDYVLVSQNGNVATYQCSRCGYRYSVVVPVVPQPPVEYGLRNGNVVVTTEHHEYIYASGQLLREVITTTDAEGNVTTETLDFTYDASGSPYTLTRTVGTTSITYYYVVNLQGDVIRLVSANGATVAEYAYDPYGRVISATGAMAEVNPLRYRGYCYDAETEFYYLQSRYYDPVICRFVNADGYASTGQEFLGKNMFAYCCNCPIILIDLSGTSASKVTILYDSNWFYGSQPSFCWLVAQQLYKILTSCLVYSVELVPFDSTSDFIEEWNNLEECDVLIIVMHGGVDCLGYNPCVGSDNTYSYDELNDIAVNDAVILTSCNGGTRDEHGRSAAQAVANKAGCPVRAVTDGEVYASPFSGAIFPTGDGFWETFYPESKRRVIPKDSLSLPQ